MHSPQWVTASSLRSSDLDSVSSAGQLVHRGWSANRVKESLNGGTVVVLPCMRKVLKRNLGLLRKWCFYLFVIFPVGNPPDMAEECWIYKATKFFFLCVILEGPLFFYSKRIEWFWGDWHPPETHNKDRAFMGSMVWPCLAHECLTIPLPRNCFRSTGHSCHGSNLFHVQAVIVGINYAGSEMCFLLFFSSRYQKHCMIEVGTSNYGNIWGFVWFSDSLLTDRNMDLTQKCADLSYNLSGSKLVSPFQCKPIIISIAMLIYTYTIM